MVQVGKIMGFRTYSFVPDGSKRPVQGYVMALVPEENTREDVEGVFPDVGSISFADMGTYVPRVGDEVQYVTFRANGKQKFGFINPL